MLAYSTNAQMGYALFSIGVGLRHGIPDAVRAGFFLILAHAAMKALAFMSKGICHFYCGTSLIEELKGTYQRLPVVAVSFTIALVGLAGVSPLAGFAGKWLILSELYRTADWVVYVGIAVFLLNTLVSLGYYLPAIAMLFTPAREEVPARIRVSGWMAVPVVGLTLLVLALGVAPGPWLRWSEGLLGFW
jgi:formate hydrogenlyase subunit 3/multisubunit Na+/H+ antiporter MnhD subunit